jgi:hypothetical protein
MMEREGSIQKEEEGASISLLPLVVFLTHTKQRKRRIA